MKNPGYYWHSTAAKFWIIILTGFRWSHWLVHKISMGLYWCLDHVEEWLEVGPRAEKHIKAIDTYSGKLTDKIEELTEEIRDKEIEKKKVENEDP